MKDVSIFVNFISMIHFLYTYKILSVLKCQSLNTSYKSGSSSFSVGSFSAWLQNVGMPQGSGQGSASSLFVPSSSVISSSPDFLFVYTPISANLPDICIQLQMCQPPLSLFTGIFVNMATAKFWISIIICFYQSTPSLIFPISMTLSLITVSCISRIL